MAVSLNSLLASYAKSVWPDATVHVHNDCERISVIRTLERDALRELMHDPALALRKLEDSLEPRRRGGKRRRLHWGRRIRRAR